MLCVFCSENWLLLTPTVSKQETELQIPTTLPSSKSPEAKRSFELLEKAFLRRVPEALHWQHMDKGVTASGKVLLVHTVLSLTEQNVAVAPRCLLMSDDIPK